MEELFQSTYVRGQKRSKIEEETYRTLFFSGALFVFDLIKDDLPDIKNTEITKLVLVLHEEIEQWVALKVEIGKL